MSTRLIVDVGRLLYIGPVGVVPNHRCTGTVVAFGLDGEFEVVTAQDRQVLRCGCVAAGEDRAVDAFGGRLGVLVVDPELSVTTPLDTARVLAAGEALARGYSAAGWQALQAAVLPAPEGGATDPRVRAAAEQLLATSDSNLPTAAIAAAVGLSPSRLEHLFAAQIGVPMRSYRLWCRFRRVAQAVARGAPLTAAAHEAGFFDSAHLTHAFRQSFGIPPAFVFQPGLQTHVVGAAP